MAYSLNVVLFTGWASRSISPLFSPPDNNIHLWVEARQWHKRGPIICLSGYGQSVRACRGPISAFVLPASTGDWLVVSIYCSAPGSQSQTRSQWNLRGEGESGETEDFSAAYLKWSLTKNPRIMVLVVIRLQTSVQLKYWDNVRWVAK